MTSKNYLFTSESVTEGHPDKLADQISDAILDAMLEQDPFSRVACETLVTTGAAVISGEVTTKAQVDVAQVVRKTVREVGYTDTAYGFDADSCAVMVTLGRQSPDIAQGVNDGDGLYKEQGAGDQGMMFGYAIDETPQLMPMSIAFSHKLTRRLAEVRKSGEVGWLRPDGKAQVTIEYRDGVAARVDAIVVSTQHSPDVEYGQIRDEIVAKVIRPVIDATLMDDNTKMFINPTGRFVIGGPHGDCGLTGRKIIVDTYGGHGGHGGGAFSGKDPSKVDRSAAYMARHIAKNVVASKLADRCLVQLAYAIGVADPVSVMVDTFGTASIADERIAEAVRELFPLKPAGMIKYLDLARPIYQRTAAGGHFGRDEEGFTWELTSMADKLAAIR